MGVPSYVIQSFSPIAFSILSLSFIFVSLITKCLSLFLFGFILPDILCFLDMVNYFPFPCQRRFWILLFQISSQVLSLFSFWDPYNVNVGVFNVVPQFSWNVFFFFFFLHPFFYILLCGSDFYHHVLQVMYPFFCLSYSAIDSFQYIIHPCLSVLQFFQGFSKHFFHLLHCFPQDPGSSSLSLF